MYDSLDLLRFLCLASNVHARIALPLLPAYTRPVYFLNPTEIPGSSLRSLLRLPVFDGDEQKQMARAEDESGGKQAES